MTEDWRSLDLPGKEQSMLEYVKKITLTATSITKDDLDGLRSVSWTDREIKASGRRRPMVLARGHLWPPRPVSRCVAWLIFPDTL